MTIPIETVQFGDEEIATIDSFRQSRNTAVLTIMFTDIVGFTKLTEEKGEQYSNDLRHLHDQVLEEAITAGGAGVVIKHIGDAIMAVFSEPSTAVERALRIHEGLERLAAERTDIAPVVVRVGLDMGQVTLEDTIDLDVFGRHVNRASRVEGLAGGGQVFMTYPVFDSARGWLAASANTQLKWRSHGRYRLKGVSAPVEIFEVADAGRRTLQAPRAGKKVRSVPGLAWAAGFVLLGIAGTVGLRQFGATELWLARYAPPLSYLDGKELRLGGEPGDGERQVLLEVKPGRHVLHYEVADAVRYYAELDLKRGANHLRPRFTESRLPTLSRSVTAGEEPARATREQEYFFYEDGARTDHRATIELKIEVFPAEGSRAFSASFSWRVELDGKTVAKDSRTVTRVSEEDDWMKEEIEVYSDKWHSYVIRLRMWNETAHSEIIASFLDAGDR